MQYVKYGIYYGIYREKNMRNVIYFASGNGRYEPAIYENMQTAIKICDVINSQQQTKDKHVVAKFNTFPHVVISTEHK